MGGDSDDELSLSSNVGGCAVIGAIYGGVKAAWALAPTAKAPGTSSQTSHRSYYVNESTYWEVSLVNPSVNDIFVFLSCSSSSCRCSNSIFRSSQHHWQDVGEL